MTRTAAVAERHGATARSPGPANGSTASSYEQAFAELVGVRHAIAFGSGRTAITVALGLIDAPGADRVLVSALTCRVVPLAVERGGCRPVYVDIDRSTLNLASDRVAAALGSDARAVLFQHTYGHDGGLDLVWRLLENGPTVLIEDRAQMLPHPGVPPLRGLAAIYSNNLLKPLPAGSGAVLVTDDDRFAVRARIARDALPAPSALARARARVEETIHDRWLTPERYWIAYDLHRRLSSGGSPNRSSLIDREILAAEVRPTARQLGRGTRSIAAAPGIAAARIAAVAAYREGLAGLDVGLSWGPPPEPLYYFPVLVPDKPHLLREARRRRIEIVAWPISQPIYPVETEPDLRALGYPLGGCPAAEWVAGRLIGLPTRLGDRHPQVRAAIALVRAALEAPGVVR